MDVKLSNIKKAILGIIMTVVISTTAFAWNWNETNDTTFTVLKEPTSLDIHKEGIDWEEISVFHDNERNATCWISQSRFGEGLSCLYDKK